MMTLALLDYPYGFFRIRGFFGLVIGIVLMIVVLWALWGIFDVVAKKFGNENTAWMFQIVRYILIVMTVFFFVNAMFSLIPWGW
jgi:divalent metal cation (Fe/Co/Zn/Cd) transporter